MSKQLLIIDDDDTFIEVLARAFAKREYHVTQAISNEAALSKINSADSFDYAVVDLRIGNDSGLELIPELIKLNNNMRIVVLTGFASIATAIEAIKLGATHYLTKPTDIDEIISAFNKEQGQTEMELAEKPLSLERLEWEHIQKVLNECDGNVSEAARQLNMHRRTLQRKLLKRPSGLT